MSSVSIDCGFLLLKEHFGEIVAMVAQILMTKGAQPLGNICNEVKAPKLKITKALCVLIQHNMVTFKLNHRYFVEYSIDQQAILLLMRYPTYIYCTKKLHGEAAELIIEDLLLNGQATMSSTIEKATNRLNDALDENAEKISYSFVQDKFECLVKIQFLQRCSQSEPRDEEERENREIPSFVFDRTTEYSIPNINIQLMHGKRKCEDDNESQPAAKKQKLETVKQSDDGIYWRVNFDKFHQYFRDQLLVSAISESNSKVVADVLKIMLCLAETTTDSWEVVTKPVSTISITQEMKLAGSAISSMDLDCFLSVLSGDSNRFVSKVGDSQGGMYVVNRRDAITSITWATVESVVQERFGSKCLRIFRLVRMKKFLEQKQIEVMAMIPPKDAKEMTYKMFSENFLQVKELSKTPDHVPSRTFYLFHINLTHVAQAVLEWCYKTMINLIRRRLAELADSKRLLEKQTRVEAILTSLKQQGADEQQMKEVQDMITLFERAQLEKIKNFSKRLEMGEIQLNETILVLQVYLRYLKEKV